MPTKADRKHLDATVAAFHSHYASDANWGSKRWEESLYPALTRPTRYSALVNQYVPRAEFDKVVAAVPADELQLVQLPQLGKDSTANAASEARPRVLLYERVQKGSSKTVEEVLPLGNTEKDDDAVVTTTAATAAAAAAAKEDEPSFLFPTPQPIFTPGNAEKGLLSHWNMDAASALCAHMLNVQPNDKVLDLCAAPGGKSVTLAQLIFPHLHADRPLSASGVEVEAAAAAVAAAAATPAALGCLHSNEVDHARNKRLAANLGAYLPASLFESNAVRVLRLDGADARAFTQLPLGPGCYDRVLLDAPCSSERHILHAHLKAASAGRIADEMSRWRRGGSKTLAKLQTDLLMTALRAVRVGGRVVYSTCSIETGENDGVVERMLAAVDKERKKYGLGWKPRFELGSEAAKKKKVKAEDTTATATTTTTTTTTTTGVNVNAAQSDPVLNNMTEETKYGRIAVPDHPSRGQWGPLYFCVITKVARKA